MNTTNNKTLLITTAVALRVLSIANALRDTEVTDGERALVANAEFDNFKIEHEHVEEGKQILLCDRINDNLFSISFVGSEKFLEQIGSQGWTNSAEALVNYLTDLNPEVQFSLDEFRCEEMGEQFVVYSLASEKEIDPTDEQLAGLFFGKLCNEAQAEVERLLDFSQPAGEEVLRSVEDAVQTDAIAEAEDAGSHAADHLQDDTTADVDSTRVRDFRRKAAEFITSPFGIAACVAVVGVVGYVAHALASNATNGASDQLLG